MDQHEGATRFAFGLFEADVPAGELWKAGRKIKLQSQPFKLLVMLLEKPGVVVTREELQIRMWGKDTVGDFDRSLGTAVNKIREALGDSAENPRFVETLARRGYRWVAPVAVLARSGVGAAEVNAKLQEEEIARPARVDALADYPRPDKAPVDPLLLPLASLEPGSATVAISPAVASYRRRFLRWPLPVIGALLVLCSVLLWLQIRPRVAVLRRIDQVTYTGTISPGMTAMENLPAGVTDGSRLYIPVLARGRSMLNEVNVRTGTLQQLSVPSEIASPALGDLSPDGSTLLLRSHLSPESELPFWIMPASGGSALRLANVVGHDATWMPDGKSVLFATGNQLFIKPIGEGATTLLATLPERAFWLRWSPDGELLRFTLLDPIAHTMRLGELNRDGKQFRLVLEHWSEPASECCGVWTGAGKSFVFQSSHGNEGGSIDLWRLPGKSVSGATRVTDGPMSYVAPIASRGSQRLYFLGLQLQSVLRRFDPVRKDYTAELPFLAEAARVEYSRDHQWVNWTDLAGRLWRAHADGSETIRLTPDSMQVFLAHWSPDNHQLALMAREPGKAWRIYIVGADGGAPEPLIEENRNEADPSWSADGQRIVFGRVTDVMGKEEGPRDLEVLDLHTRTLTSIPGSKNVFSPRWSPDGRFIAALSLDQRSLMLFNVASASWRTLAETTAADPVWASDSKSIFFHASLAESQPIYRLTLDGGQPQQVATLQNFSGAATADSFFCGLAPDDSPIVRVRTAAGNLYTMDIAER